MKNLSLASAFAILIFLGSCQKIEKSYVIKGQWDIQTVTLNGGSKNMMESLLPDYIDGDTCCEYQVLFDDEGNMYGYYYTHDTLNYAETGTWEWVESMTFSYYLNPYIDGIFTVERDKDNKKTWLMRSIRNNIEYYDIGEVEMEMVAVRSKRKD